MCLLDVHAHVQPWMGLRYTTVGYTTSDVIYRWNKERPAVAIAEDMKLSQFDLVDCPAGNLTDVVYKASSPYHQTARDAGGRMSHQIHSHSHHQHEEKHGSHHNNDNSLDSIGGGGIGSFGSKTNKTLTTFAGPAAKNQHVRGTGIQLDKGGFGVGGGAGGGRIRLESDQSCK